MCYCGCEYVQMECYVRVELEFSPLTTFFLADADFSNRKLLKETLLAN